MVKPVEEILNYKPEEFYALDKETRRQYVLRADKVLRKRYERELLDEGERWIIYIDGYGIVCKSRDNVNIIPTNKFLDNLEKVHRRVAFLVHHESTIDGFLSEKPKSKEPTLNERLELRLTGL